MSAYSSVKTQQFLEDLERLKGAKRWSRKQLAAFDRDLEKAYRLIPQHPFGQMCNCTTETLSRQASVQDAMIQILGTSRTLRKARISITDAGRDPRGKVRLLFISNLGSDATLFRVARK